jgi:type 1 fimbria pilin
MKSTFQRSKINLTIAALAAGLGLHLASNAQSVVNDSGTLTINGQISASTCVLGISESGGTNTVAGNKTIALPTVTPTALGNENGVALASSKRTVVFGILASAAASSSACTLGGGNGFWDLGVQLASTQVSSVPATPNSILINSGAGAATGVGVLIKTTAGAAPTEGTGYIDLLTKTYNNTYTLLSSASASQPNVAAANKIALTAQYIKLGTANATAGSFNVSLPLTLWYR